MPGKMAVPAKGEVVKKNAGGLQLFFLHWYFFTPDALESPWQVGREGQNTDSTALFTPDVFFIRYLGEKRMPSFSRTVPHQEPDFRQPIQFLFLLQEVEQLDKLKDTKLKACYRKKELNEARVTRSRREMQAPKTLNMTKYIFNKIPNGSFYRKQLDF